ncbi:hypothetical protein GZ77_22085 [Endozoicomonas montiporae]|uniref:ABC transporter domain-containing protein n=2 Tax=Endozoicomonas montiporae TaxID=1027273 RepID=A0A081N050_9GAMM|nr:ABC transporter ATP-binding protein [Endozoicomonas montiporae]AMO58839.1 iron(III) transport system ATP-binding protein [Endozoicomonas montiporae CL-33]KEQ11823.1 hypothetical protein GZ77_22085 [Endozoicomonas montiporae]
MKALDINHLCYSYDSTDVLQELNLQIEAGEIVCLLGRSGCGKTTLLKAISGLIQPDEGYIALHGKTVSSSKEVLPPENRGIGMIFQDYALFPHLSVADNIAFGLRNLSQSDLQKRVQEMLELVNLHGLDKRYPHELSGGQQQRVAIARALANRPNLLLLDEPFSNIDSQVRQRLIREIRDILKQQKVAALFVTHSREEGFAFADSVAVMHEGKILQRGRSFDVYNQPSCRFVAEFMGAGNLLQGKVINSHQITTPLGIVESSTKVYAQPETTVELFIRPQMLTVEKCECDDPADPAFIRHQQFMGRSLRTEVELENKLFVVDNVEVLPEKTPVHIHVKDHALVLFNEQGQTI